MGIAMTKQIYGPSTTILAALAIFAGMALLSTDPLIAQNESAGNQTGEAMQSAGNQTVEGVQAAGNATGEGLQAAVNETGEFFGNVSEGVQEFFNEGGENQSR